MLKDGGGCADGEKMTKKIGDIDTWYIRERYPNASPEAQQSSEDWESKVIRFKS